MRKPVLLLALVFIFVAILSLAFNVRRVKASGTVYIRADGLVFPSNAPIQHEGNTYTLTDNINDSIVISDRIREKYKKMRKEPYNVVLNTGLNEVLSRTLLTVGTTLLAVIALLIFGGSVIADFAFTLLVGFIIGTYSSIFILANIVSIWEEKFPKKK